MVTQRFFFKFKLIAAVVGCLLSLAPPQALARPKVFHAEVLETPEPSASPGLRVRWDRTRVPVQQKSAESGSQYYVTLTGRLEESAQGPSALIHQNRIFHPGADGRFKVEIAIRGVENTYELKAVDPFGSILTRTIQVRVENYSELAAPAKKVNLPASTASSASAPNGASLSLGPTLILHSESQEPGYTAINVTLKGAFTRSFLHPRLILSASAYMTAYTLASSLPDLSVRYLGANLRLGYSALSPQSPWQISVSAGLFYGTMLVSPANFGYKNLLYPQVYPALTRRLSDRNTLGAYFKFVPLSESLLAVNLREREWAVGLFWDRALGESKALTFGMDVSDLSFRVPSGKVINSGSYSASAGLKLKF